MEKKGKQKDNEKMRGSWELVLVTVLSRSGTSARLCPFPFSLSLLGFDDFSSSHFLFFPRVGVLALFVCVFFFFFFLRNLLISTASTTHIFYVLVGFPYLLGQVEEV